MMTKFITYTLLIATLGLLIFSGFKINQLNNQLDSVKADLGAKLLEGNLALGRAATTIADANKKIQELDSLIQKDINERDAKIVSYTNLIAKYLSQGQGKLTTPVTPVTPRDDTGKPLLSLPFTFEDFRLKVFGDAITHDFRYELTQRFELKFAETKLPSGMYNQYAELYELDPTGKRVGKLELTKFDVVRSSEIPKPSFNFWNPKVDLGISILLNKKLSLKPTGMLGVSIFSYGNTKSDISWRFARLSMDFNHETLGLGLTPVLYNLAKPWPLVDNLWIGPSIGIDLGTKNYYFSFGITATL